MIPQMSPMLWFYLFVMFICLFIAYIIVVWALPVMPQEKSVKPKRAIKKISLW